MSLKPEMLSEINQGKAESGNYTDIVKSVYAFKFLGLNTKLVVDESDLENSL